MARIRTGKIAAATAVSIYLAAILGSVLHFVIVPHEICTEHGRLVHGHESVDHDHGDATHRLVVHVHSDGAALSATGSPHAASGHEHCALDLHQPPAGRLDDRPSGIESDAVQQGFVAAGIVHFETRKALILGAPKQSPPA
jgi:hypothetical protein